MVSLNELTTALKFAVDNGNYAACEKLLPTIRLELIKNNLLVPDLKESLTNTAYFNDLCVSRSIIECASICSINLEQFQRFEQFFTQLKPYYFNEINSKLSASGSKNKLTSLYLLHLLSNGNVTKYHEELDFFSKKIANIEDDEYCSYPIKVEKWLMEGSYQKVKDLLTVGGDKEEFKYFSKILLNQIREEIAINTETAYAKLSLSTAKALLFLDNEKQMEQYAIKMGWTIDRGVIVFKSGENKEEEMETEESKDPQQYKIISQVLDYAISYETIV